MSLRTVPVLMLVASIATGVFLAVATHPAVASAEDDPVCTEQVDSRIEPGTGPGGTAAIVSWNFGTPGPLVIATWDGEVLLNGVEPRKVDDCYRGVDITVPMDAKPGVHTVVVSCAYCLVPEEYARLPFTVTEKAGATPPATATATPPAPRPPSTGNGTADEQTLPAFAVVGLALLFVVGVVVGVRQMEYATTE